MSKYINAEELKDKITAQFGTRYEMSCFDIVSIIMDFPSADVRENKHGEWIQTNPLNTWISAFECSVCGMQVPVPKMCSPFCPLCGADMRERKEIDE